MAFTTLANIDKALQLMLRLETTLNRMYNRALKTLQELQKHRPQPAESPTSEILRNDPKPAESPSLENHKSVPREKLRNDPNPAQPIAKREITEPREPTPKT